MSSSVSVSPASKCVRNLLAIGDSAIGEFAFVVEGVKFTCNKLASCLFSAKVSRLLSSDITCSRMIVESKNSKDVFGKIRSLIEGKVVAIEEKELNTFLDVTMELESDDYSEVIFKNNELTTKNCIDRLMFYFNHHQKSEECTSFVASHFCELDRSSILSLSTSTLALVLSSKLLKLNSDTWLFDFINEHHSQSKEENSLQLLEFVEMSMLPPTSLSLFISIVEEFSLFTLVWPSMKRMLTNPDMSKLKAAAATTTTISTINRITSDGTIRGLFNHLYITEKDTIQVNASSTLNNDSSFIPEKVIDGDESTWWHSENSSGSTLTVNLVKHHIRVDSYVLKSHSNRSLKSWIFEGRSNGVWKTLDKQTKDKDFISDKIQTFPCRNSETFDAFRIIQTAKNSRHDNFFVLRNFDVFGEIENIN